jgi:hypothetical protein
MQVTMELRLAAGERVFETERIVATSLFVESLMVFTKQLTCICLLVEKGCSRGVSKTRFPNEAVYYMPSKCTFSSDSSDWRLFEQAIHCVFVRFLSWDDSCRLQ